MSWLWGKKKKEPTVNAQTAGEKNAETIEMMNKKIEQLDRQAENMAKEAKAAMAKKNKKKALECMKRKKMYENQSTKFSQMRDNLEAQVITLQQAKFSAQAFNQYAMNTKAIKTELAGFDADKIDEIREENEEVTDQLNEMTDILAQPGADTADPDELEDELNQLMEEGDEVEEPGEAEPAARGKPAKEAEDEDAEAIMAQFGGI